jgi:hypothetical protein
LRQAKGRAQWAQVFVGKSDFLRIFAMPSGVAKQRALCNIRVMKRG